MYEDEESIIKFFDYIQRDKNMSLGDLIEYRYNIINILKKHNKYDKKSLCNRGVVRANL